MKKIFLILSLSILLFAGENKNNLVDVLNSSEITLSSNVVSEKTIEIEKRGCCSWHGGVSGCRNGRVVCADGSLSPSCTCLGGEPITPNDKIN